MSAGCTVQVLTTCRAKFKFIFVFLARGVSSARPTSGQGHHPRFIPTGFVLTFSVIVEQGDSAKCRCQILPSVLCVLNLSLGDEDLQSQMFALEGES